ncbi:hypothetical protein Tco_0957290 [Tanacetum coccineum]
MAIGVSEKNRHSMARGYRLSSCTFPITFWPSIAIQGPKHGFDDKVGATSDQVSIGVYHQLSTLSQYSYLKFSCAAFGQGSELCNISDRNTPSFMIGRSWLDNNRGFAGEKETTLCHHCTMIWIRVEVTRNDVTFKLSSM